MRLSWPCRNRRSYSSLTHTRSQPGQHFYQNRHLELYAARQANRLTLRQLTFAGRHLDEERLIKNANYVRTELPVRIAHRLKDLQSLPYIVVTQEGVARVYELYSDAFDRFRRYPTITNLEENEQFCRFLADRLQEHAVVIPNLSLGLSLSSPLLPPDELDSFMRRMLVSRISRRVLAEHHISLSRSLTSHVAQLSDGPHVGIIFTGLNVKRSIDKCARLLRERPLGIEDHYGEASKNKTWPEVVVDGHLDTHFSYIREHLEYVVFELLKNAMRATSIQHNGASHLPPISATIVAGDNDIGIRISDQGGGLLDPSIKSPSDLFSFSHVRNAARLEDSRLGALRTASSCPRGIRATVDEQVGRWQLSKQQESTSTSSAMGNGNPEMKAGIEPHPRIGIGLPMSNIFATYFGGSLELVSLDSWGTDVYLRLPKLGTNLEDIEV